MATNDNNGGWIEYGKLVLSELERHNDLLMKISEKLDAIKLQQALYEQEIGEVKSEVRDHSADIKDLKIRVYKLEQGELIAEALSRYRRWILAGGFGIVASVVIPIASMLVKIFT